MKKKIICFGNTVVDQFAFVEEEFIKENDFPKSCYKEITSEEYTALSKKVNFVGQDCGGSGLNVMKGLGAMGMEVAIVGTYSQDEGGDIIERSLRKYNIKDLSGPRIVGKFSDYVCCFITPDKQRTMVMAFCKYEDSDYNKIDYSIISGYDCCMFEGYHFTYQKGIERTFAALDYCKKNNVEMALIISNITCIEMARKEMQEVAHACKIISGNDEEFLSIFEKDSMEDLIQYFKTEKKFKALAITCGPKGAWLIIDQKEYFFEAPKVEVVDPTGAGDAFTSGFMYAYMNNYPPEICGKIACIFAGEVISHIGASPNMENIRREIEKLLSSEGISL